MRNPRSAQQAPPPAAMVHLYRGLMDRGVTWRSRIDTPTNWTVAISGTSASFVLSDSQHHHVSLLLTLFFCMIFWFIEARRYRYYDLWATWTRIMETDYYAPLLGQNTLAVDQYWHKLLLTDMQSPHFKITLADALGRRLRHNYLAIFVFLGCVWMLKLLIHPQTPATGDLAILVADAAIGPIGGKIVLFVMMSVFFGLFLLSLLTLPRFNSRPELVTHEQALRKLSQPDAMPVSYRLKLRRKYDKNTS